MKLITEMFDDFEVLSEGKNGKDLKIKGVFMQAETKNRNGRMSVSYTHLTLPTSDLV